MISKPFEGAMYLSDFHAGRKTHQKKEAAIESVRGVVEQTGIRYAGLLGDIADNRPLHHQVGEDACRLRASLNGMIGITIPGNHDDETHFPSAQLQDWTGLPVDQLIVTDRRTGVVVTHGHLFGARKVKHALREAKVNLETVIDLAQSDILTLHRDAALGYRAEQALAFLGISASEWHEFWSHTKSSVRQQVASLLRTSNARSIRSNVADIIEDHSIASAAELARVTSSWGAVTGHTHDPYVRRVHTIDPVTGTGRVCLVGNSGSFVSRHAPTVITTDFPSMTLWKYHPKSDEMRPLSTVYLTSEEAAVHLSDAIGQPWAA